MPSPSSILNIFWTPSKKNRELEADDEFVRERPPGTASPTFSESYRAAARSVGAPAGHPLEASPRREPHMEEILDELDPYHHATDPEDDLEIEGWSPEDQPASLPIAGPSSAQAVAGPSSGRSPSGAKSRQSSTTVASPHGGSGSTWIPWFGKRSPTSSDILGTPRSGTFGSLPLPSWPATPSKPPRQKEEGTPGEARLRGLSESTYRDSSYPASPGYGGPEQRTVISNPSDPLGALQPLIHLLALDSTYSVWVTGWHLTLLMQESQTGDWGMARAPPPWQAIHCS